MEELNLNNQIVSEEFKRYLNESPETKTVFNWYDSRNFRGVKLDFEIQKKIFRLLLSKLELKKSEKINGISKYRIKDYIKTSRSIPVRILKKAMNTLEIPLISIESKIVELSGIKNPKLPFNLNTPEGAEIRLAFLSDGHNPKDATKNLKYQAGEIESHKNLTELANKLFGELDIRIHKEKENKYQSYFPCVIGDVIEPAGVPRGNKTLINPYMPKDIFMSRELLVHALRRSFTDEGSCYSRRNHYIRLERNVDITRELKRSKLSNFAKNHISKSKVNMSKYANHLITGEYLGLRGLGIYCRLNAVKLRKNMDKTMTLTWRLSITRISEMEKFKEKIGFLLHGKNEKLNEILLKKYDRFYRIKDALEVSKKLSKNNKTFTYQKFSKSLGVHPNRGLFHLRRLIANGDACRYGKNQYKVCK